jgi:hypothetical protein
VVEIVEYFRERKKSRKDERRKKKVFFLTISFKISIRVKNNKYNHNYLVMINSFLLIISIVFAQQIGDQVVGFF